MDSETTDTDETDDSDDSDDSDETHSDSEPSTDESTSDEPIARKERSNPTSLSGTSSKSDREFILISFASFIFHLIHFSIIFSKNKKERSLLLCYVMRLPFAIEAIFQI